MHCTIKDVKRRFSKICEMVSGNFQTLSATIVIESLFSGHENVLGNVNASGLARTWNVTAISWARSSGINTCNHEAWATNGCSESTNVPVTECATSVIAVSPRTDLKVKCLPCLTRPLKKTLVKNSILQVNLNNERKSYGDQQWPLVRGGKGS